MHRSVLAALTVLVLVGLYQAPEHGRAQGGNSSDTGTYGPAGEWIPFAPTPTVDSSIILSPTPTEGLGQPTKTPTPTSTASPTNVPYISVTPEFNVTLTPLPNETDYITPERLTSTPGPSQTPEDIITATAEATALPTETVDPSLTQTATPAGTATSLPEPTDELGVATVTPKSQETSTPTPTATPTSSSLFGVLPAPNKPTAAASEMRIKAAPQWAGLPLRREIQEGPAPAGRGRPDAIAGSDALDAGSDEMPGSGYQPSTIRGSVGLWTGSSTTNIPIDVPPGPGGSTPKIGLSYSSNVAEDVTFEGGKQSTAQETYHKTQSSPFGYGWNVSGVPVISIVPKLLGDPFNDLHFGYELSVNGVHVRLIKPYDDPARSVDTDRRTVYQTYPQAFIYVARTRKYYANEVRCGLNGVLREDRWEVITKDGTHIEFGGNENVRPTISGSCGWLNPDDRDAVQFVRVHSGAGHWVMHPGKWYATKVTDTHGNVTRFYHRREPVLTGGGDVLYDAAITIRKITYGGSTPSSHGVAIEFPVQTDQYGAEINRDDCVVWTAQGDWYCQDSLPPGTENAAYRSNRLVTAIVVKIKDRWGTWSTVRVYNLSYQFHYHSVSGHKRALLQTVQVADKLASDTSAVKLPPYTFTYLTGDATKINWLPMTKFNNGLGGEWEYTYSETTVTCKDVETGNQKGHPRRPVTVEQARIQIGATWYPVSKIDNSYIDGKCTEKFGHSYGGVWNDWYEFLGFERADQTVTDQKLTTTTGDDTALKQTKTQFNRCIEEGIDCNEASNGGNPVEPHPLKGEIIYSEVWDASGSQVLTQKTNTYSVEQNVSLGYIGLPSAPAVGTTWGHLDKTVEKKWGKTDTTGSFAAMGKVSSFAYEASLQGGIQRGMVTKQQEFVKEADYPSSPYRTKKTWYATKSSINGSDFGVSASIYIVDRVMAEGLYGGAGGSTDPVHQVVWNYYDNKTAHTDGVDYKGALTRSSRLQTTAAFITTPSFGASCTGTVQRYLTSDKKLVYTTHGNMQDEKTYPDYGQVCIVNPNQPSQAVYVDTYTPSLERKTTTTYDSQINAMPIKRESPTINGVRHTTSYEYFGLNNAAATNTEGYFVGQLYQVVDPNNIVERQHAYDKLGRVVKVVRAGDSLSQPTQAFVYSDDDYYPVFPTMNAVWTKRESSANPWTDGGTFERTFYDGLGRKVQIQKPHYNWVSSPVSGSDVVSFNTYDAADRVTVASSPYTKSAYTGTGTGCGGANPPCNPYVTPDTTNPKTTTIFDAADRPEKITLPDGTEINHHYGVGSGTAANQWLDDVLDPRRHRKQIQIDSLGRQKQILEYTGNCASAGMWGGYTCAGSYTTNWTLDATTSYVYDVVDRLTAMTGPSGSSTTVTYNMLGYKTAITDPDMGSWSYDTDAAGNINYQIDAGGQKVCHFYDTLYRLTEKRYFSSGSACTTTGGTAGPLYTFDAGTYGKGRRTGMNNTTGFYTGWTMDSRGRTSSEAQTLGGAGGATYTTGYGYKRNDAVASITRPEGGIVDVTYNPVGAKRTYEAGVVDYVYDTTYTASGQIDDQYLDSAGAIKIDYQYDSNTDRLTYSYAGSYPSYQQMQNLALGYDLAGNISQIVDNNISQTQTFTYDQRDRLKTAGATGGSGGTYSTETYTYHKTGNLNIRAGVTYAYHPSKIHATRKMYDATAFQSKAFSVNAIRSSACAATIYVDLYINGVWKSSGLLNAPAGTTQSVSLGTQSISADNVYDVAFSPIGASCTVSVDYVSIGGALTQAETGAMAFDAGTGSSAIDGNSVTAPSTSGAYATLLTAGALRFVSGSKAGAYEYDADGNMYWRIVDGSAYNLTWDQENRLKEVLRKGVSRALYTYDADGNRVKALTSPNGTDYYRTFYVGGLYEYTQNNGTGATTDAVRYYDASGKRVALRQGAVQVPTTLYWVLTDQVNSTTKTIADAGYTTYSELRYKPWGTARYTSGTTPTTKRFTGQREDTSVGLYYYNARYYEPSLARFISADTMVPDPNDPQDLNRYAYVKNNPIKHDDPTGHYIESALDVAFIISDIREIRSGGMTWTNGISLAADVGGLVLPGVTGGGLAVRAARSGIKALERADRATNIYNAVADGSIDGADAVTLGMGAIGAGGTVSRRMGAINSHSPAPRFLKLNRKNLRENMLRLEGRTEDSVRGLDAHHMLPHEFADKFQRVPGIGNINDPRWGAWVNARKHNAQVSGYSKDWSNWWSEYENAGKTPTYEQVMDQVRSMSRKYGIDYDNY